MKPCGRIALASSSRKLQRLVERNRRRDHALDAHGIELLELLQLPRLGRGPQLANVDSGTSLSLGAGDVDLRELIGRQPLRALDLRNDLVAPALDAEAVDVVAAEQRRQIRAGLAEVDALRAELVAIEDDLGLRLVELQVGVGEDEQPAGERLLHQLAGEIAELLRLGRRGDHEVDRESRRRPAAAAASAESRGCPGIFDSGPIDSISSCCAVLVRSLHGLVTMPPKPPVGNVS